METPPFTDRFPFKKPPVRSGNFPASREADSLRMQLKGHPELDELDGDWPAGRGHHCWKMCFVWQSSIPYVLLKYIVETMVIKHIGLCHSIYFLLFFYLSIYSFIYNIYIHIYIYTYIQYMGISIVIGGIQNGWFIREHPIKMDDGTWVPLISGNPHGWCGTQILRITRKIDVSCLLFRHPCNARPRIYRLQTGREFHPVLVAPCVLLVATLDIPIYTHMICFIVPWFLLNTSFLLVSMPISVSGRPPCSSNLTHTHSCGTPNPVSSIMTSWKINH